jgi:DNA-binding MarR family transcriptional regulator
MPARKKAIPVKSKNYEKRIVQALRKLTQSRQLLKLQDVTIPQVMCLDLLCEHGAMTLAVLASHLHISSSTMVGIVDRLEKKQFVTRTRDNVDRRSVFIDVTEEGRNFIISAPHLLHNKLHDSLQKLSEIERIQIANSLDRLILLMNNK